MAVAVSRSGYEPPYSLGDAVLCVDGTFQRLVGTVYGDFVFIARGDGEPQDKEALLPGGDILGKVVVALPGAGRVYQFLSSLWGPPVVLVVGVLLLALPSLFGLGREPAGAPAQEQPGKYRPRH